MTIEALLAGKLQGRPEQRTANTGRSFVTARLHVAAGPEETHFARITVFSDSAGPALLALGDGDALVVLAGACHGNRVSLGIGPHVAPLPPHVSAMGG